MPPKLALDHIVVTAPTLEAGIEHVRACLGVEVPPGGAHVQMGTHNRLMRLGEDEFLEIIAVDPAAPAPGRPRWFALDRYRSKPPRLRTWIARTPDLDASLAAAASVGVATEITRGGADLAHLHTGRRIDAVRGRPPDGHRVARRALSRRRHGGPRLPARAALHRTSQRRRNRRSSSAGVHRRASDVQGERRMPLLGRDPDAARRPNVDVMWRNNATARMRRDLAALQHSPWLVG